MKSRLIHQKVSKNTIAYSDDTFSLEQNRMISQNAAAYQTAVPVRRRRQSNLLLQGSTMQTVDETSNSKLEYTPSGRGKDMRTQHGISDDFTGVSRPTLDETAAMPLANESLDKTVAETPAVARRAELPRSRSLRSPHLITSAQ